MTSPVPEVVTLHLWRVPRRRVPAALVRMATDRGPVRRAPGARFARLLGTADSRWFTPRGADPTRWALVAAWASAGDAERFERSAVPRGWARLAEETCRILMRPLSCRGRWSGRHPFGQAHQPGQTSEPAPTAPGHWDGPVAALTRARLAPLRAVRFWRAVPPVADQLRTAPGLLLAFGIGEAPVGVQGTFSVWRSAGELGDFAYRGAAHAEVVRRTPEAGWYAEELFARFAVLDATGTVDGPQVLA